MKISVNMFSWVLFFILIDQGRSESVNIIYKKCCDEGRHMAKHFFDCNVNKTIKNIQPEYQRECNSLIDLCCADTIRNTTCIAGKADAYTQSSCKHADPIRTQCCESCKLGIKAGTDINGCQNNLFGSPWNEAFQSCCKDYVKRFNVYIPGLPNVCDILPEELCEHYCIPEFNSFQCACHESYHLLADGRSCSKGPLSRPTCLLGYKYDPHTNDCLDINECQINSTICNSSNHEKCVNFVGSFECTCQEGFKRKSDGTCSDVNECQLELATCNPSLRCDNTIGSYRCIRELSCGTGYTYNDDTFLCEDDDECTLGIHKCGAGFQCHNMMGSFLCVSDTLVNFHTSCPIGYQRNSKQICVDVDECASPNTCIEGIECVNTEGSYYCKTHCGEGTKFDAIVNYCVDINECEEQKPCNHTCHNIHGSFYCLCEEGYRLVDSKYCMDIDECSIYKNMCDFNCVNTIGSFECTCPNDFQLATDGYSCISYYTFLQ